MLTRSRARSIGWAAILAICFGLTVALTFRVNAVKSEVRLAERQIIALRTERGMLETEFETRANQQQLRALNAVEFGYEAPTARQYLESERQLAALGKPRGPNAPEMIRVAHGDVNGTGDSAFPAMGNPLAATIMATKAVAAELPRDGVRARELSRTSGPADLAERLSHVERLSHIERRPKAIIKPAKVPVEE